jgi:hypothetical protein
MTDRPADWYIAELLVRCADQLEALHDKDDAYLGLIIRCRDAAADLGRANHL